MARKNRINDAECSLPSKIIGFSDNYSLNERFDIRKVSIISWEDIANRFHFSKEVIDKSDYQLDMLPVVGYHDGEGFTSHGDKVIPYGAVIPNSARWEDVDDKEYKVVDVAFWKSRYSEQLKDLDNCNQSIEATNISGVFNKELGCYEVESYIYDALCLLNQNTKPAFPNAKVFDLSDFNDDFEAFKAEFAEVLQDINKEVKKNGSEPMENKKEFTLIELGQIWEAIYNQLEEKYPDSDGWGSIYRIDGIYEETSDGSKFALLRKRETQELYKVNLNIDDDGIKLAEEAMLVVEAIIETGEITRFEEPENVEKFKEFIKVEPEPIVETEPIIEPEPTNYEELYNELQTKFNELVTKCSDLETEIVPLREFKADIETKENQAKAEMELKEKNDLIESFATKLPKKSIEDIIDDVTKFTLDEIKMKLSIALADQILANEIDDNAEFSDVTINIDNMNKSISREERLIAEIKSKKRN